VTLSGDEIIGESLCTNSALVPVTVTEFGQFGSLFERFLFRKEAMTIPKFEDSQKYAKAAAELVRSTKIPHSYLPTANAIWPKEPQEEFHGHSYKTMDPTTCTLQQLGLITSTAISNHILGAHKKIKSRPPKDNEKIEFGSLLLGDASFLATDTRQYGIVGNGTRRGHGPSSTKWLSTYA